MQANAGEFTSAFEGDSKEIEAPARPLSGASLASSQTLTQITRPQMRSNGTAARACFDATATTKSTSKRDASAFTAVRTCPTIDCACIVSVDPGHCFEEPVGRGVAYLCVALSLQGSVGQMEAGFVLLGGSLNA
jgi:hypothetical protein